MLVIKRKMNTIKQHGKGDNVHQKPPTSHNSLKTTIRETLLKAFSMSTYIMTQLRCRLRKVQMLKGMASQPLGVDIPN
jgi:hypothetical protein